MLHALRERYQLIEHRADALLDSEIAADAPWLRGIPRHGADPQRWRATARLVAAYRDRWGITGTQPLGPPPDATAPHAHHADHRRAANALALHHSAHGAGNPFPVPAAPVSGQRRREACNHTTIPTSVATTRRFRYSDRRHIDGHARSTPADEHVERCHLQTEVTDRGDAPPSGGPTRVGRSVRARAKGTADPAGADPPG